MRGAVGPHGQAPVLPSELAIVGLKLRSRGIDLKNSTKRNHDTLGFGRRSSGGSGRGRHKRARKGRRETGASATIVQKDQDKIQK